MSPAWMTRPPGMPWMTWSLIEMQALPGNPPYPKKDGLAPWERMNFFTARSISPVLTPGSTISPASFSTCAERRQAFCMAVSSREFLRMIIP